MTVPVAPPPTPAQRWWALLLVSLALFGNYYAYDALNPVVDLLREQRGFSYGQIGALSTAYNVAALLVLLAGGYAIDRWGTKRAIPAFAAVCVAAAALTAWGPDHAVMLAGRFLLGVGSEPLIVAATTVLAKWFSGRELGFAFGLNLSLARLGSAAADWSPSFAGPLFVDWQGPLWLATGVAAAALVAALLYWRLECRAGDGFAAAPGAEGALRLRDLYAFDARYWHAVALCVAFYATIFPFRSFAIDYFQQAHGLARGTAGMLSSLLPVSAIVLTPLFGLWADRVGHRGRFMAVGALAMLPLFLAVTWLPPGPALPLPGPGGAIPLTLLLVVVVLGAVFSLVPAVLWPAVADLVDARRLGSAYAMMTFCQQVGWAVVPPVVGLLNDRAGAGPENPAGYAHGMWLYTALAALGAYFALRLWRAEARAARVS